MKQEKKQEREFKKIEKDFGKIEVFRLLAGENVLGKIDDIPVCSGTAMGSGSATITDKRFIIESEIIGNDNTGSKKYLGGRDIIHYEVDLDEIKGIVFKSSDLRMRRGNVIAFVLFLIFALGFSATGLLLLQEMFTIEILADNFELVSYISIGFGAILFLISLIFLPLIKKLRKLTLEIRSNSGSFILSDDKESDFPIVVTNECVDKMTVLAKGIRHAQKKK